ncbi:MAG: T9SS type A sorting domain-containing protein [Melioribacteraceae bacterium]
MKRFSYSVIFFALLFLAQIQAQLLTRTAEIKEPSGKEAGFGGVIAGVDFDKDGKPEIYACNTNMVDRPYELVPRIYKFELNPVTAKWDSVWSATAPLEKQNTWPAFTWGDLDKDGKPEIYWAPVNYSPYPDVARILVYEYPGDGSDNMGVADGLGGFLPNAMTNIEAGAGINLRPIRFIIADPDKDGKDELIFADRQGYWKVGILSVDNIPNLGGGTEKWTVEFKGTDDAVVKTIGACRDVAVIDNIVYVIENSSGKVVGAKYENGAWKGTKLQSTVAGGNASFKGSSVIDLNNDGKKEILLAGNNTGAKIWLLQQEADTLKSTQLVDTTPIGATRLNGAAVGDIDGDGKIDFVTASYHSTANTRKVPVIRVEYQGGDIASASNYVASVIDSAYWANNGNMDVVVIANVDGDKEDEVLYTQGYTLGNPNDDRMPLIVLDSKYTKVSVEKIDNNIPTQFNLEQNYPNPFNPSTQIKFGISEASNIELKIYDILGREVAVLINKEFMNAGSYSVKFNAGNLASGIYIYKLSTEKNTISKKMQLLK